MKQAVEDEANAVEEVRTSDAGQISDDRRRLMARLTAMTFSAPLVLASLTRTAAAGS